MSPNELPQARLESEHRHPISAQVSCGGNVNVSPDKTGRVYPCVCVPACVLANDTNSEEQSATLTCDTGTFLRTEDTLAGPRRFKRPSWVNGWD